MSLFAPNKEFKVRGVILKLINAIARNWRAVQRRRNDRRVSLAVVGRRSSTKMGKSKATKRLRR